MADPAYVDLTMTQYASGLELLKDLRILRQDWNSAWVLSSGIRNLPAAQSRRIVFERILEYTAPAWLRDADVLVPDLSELPVDAVATADALELDEQAAFSSIQNVQGHIDLELRKTVGLTGEHALIHLLETRWPGSVTHVADLSDGFGYDILFRHENSEWHLEVKTTGRQGRLLMFISRHEYDVSLRDRQWRMVIVGLDRALKLRALATVKDQIFNRRGPVDLMKESRWQSASHELTDLDLNRGLSFIEESDVWEKIANHSEQEDLQKIAHRFTWLPR